MLTSFSTFEFHVLTCGDHGDPLPWSFCSNLGSIGAYSVLTMHMWSNFQPVDTQRLVPVNFVQAILSKFHA